MASISNSATDARKQEYIKKYGSLPPGVTLSSQPAAKSSTLSGSRTIAPNATKPSTRLGTPPAPASPVKTPTKSAEEVKAAEVVATGKDPIQVGKENAQTFMTIIASMPVETRNRYISAFTDFLALSVDEQASYLEGLQTSAEEIVKPKIDQARTRLNEDFEYEKSKRETEKRQLNETFNKIVKDLDFNKTRDIAKENETAAKTMQNVGNTAFVTGIAGSGIFSRRTAYVRENLQNKVEDINVDYSQKEGKLSLDKSQADQVLDDQIQNLFDLNARDLSDLEQTKKQDELSIFLELAGNEFGQKGEQNTKLIEAGVGSDLGSAEEDFAQGGTDAERKAKYNSGERYLTMKPEDILSDKFDAGTLARVAELAARGDVVGETEGRATFSTAPRDSSDIGFNDYKDNWADKVKLYRDIQSGKFKSEIRGQIRSAT